VPTVLVVEDDPDIRAALCEVLERASYEVVQASNGAEAMELVRAQTTPFALILLDWLLPAMTGAEVVASLAQDPTHRATPILVLSGHDRVLQGGGVAAVVAKPVRTRTLIDVVDRLAGMAPRSMPDATPVPVPVNDGMSASAPTTRYTARTVALRPPRS